MGLFSIFKGKKEAPDGSADFPDSRLRGEPTRSGFGSEEERARQREIARATALKIDAIEKAMVSDIFDAEPEWGSGAWRARKHAENDSDGPTLPMEMATTELLGGDEPFIAVQAEAAPLADEVALMWANGETELAGRMLASSLGEDRSVWWMLFDLYQATGNQDAFDNLAIDYASRFETSPPTFAAPDSAGAHAFAGVMPTESFSGRLDASIGPRLARLSELAATSQAFRIEFTGVRHYDAEGCALLLATLQRLRALQRELVLSGAAELAALLKGTLEIGKREADPAPWLLLLELLLLLNREKEFEETAMDYCITYEVSPPSFEPPRHVATTAPARAAAVSDRFTLPAVIEGVPHELFDAIDLYVSQYEPAVLDCARLVRVDYAAAGELLARLRPHAATRQVELRDMNHLVAALFRLVGLAGVARIFPHKY